MDFVDLSKIVGTSYEHQASSPMFFADVVEEEQPEEIEKNAFFEEEEQEEEEAPVSVKVEKVEEESKPAVTPSSYLVVPKKNELLEHEANIRKKKIEMRNKLFRKLQEATIIDTTLTAVSMRSIQGTVMFFAIFMTIAMKFGEIKYLAPIFILSFILFYLVNRFVLKEIIYLRNDCDAGWNFALHFGGDILSQILLLVAAAFTYEIIRQNPSIHPKDAFITLIKNVVMWFAISFYLLKRLHYIILRNHVVNFLVHEEEAPMLLCAAEQSLLTSVN